MRRLVAAVALLLVLLLGVAVVAISAIAADRLVHPVRGAIDQTPAEFGLAYEDVRFRADDGVALGGWWIPAEPDEGTILLLHGYAKTRLEVLPHAEYLHEAGYNVLLFDWRAHGRSEGAFTSLGYHERRDLRGAVDEALRRSDAPLGALGYSMGAATAILGGADDLRLAAIVVDSPFATIEASLDTAFPILSNPKLPAFPFAPVALRIAEVQTGLRTSDIRPVDAIGRWAPRPILVVVGTRDQLVPPSESDRLVAAAAGNARLVSFEGAAHPSSGEEAWIADPSRYEREVLAFFEAALAN